MKQLFTFLLSMAYVTLAYSQTTMEDRVEMESIKPGFTKKYKTSSEGEVSEWFNYGRLIYDLGGDVSYYRNFLFPDSTVVVEYSSGNGPVWKHSFGEVFDPTSPYFAIENTELDSSHSFILDSIVIPYRYYRYVDSIPDTVIVQIFEHDDISFVEDPWQDDRSYSTVDYNSSTRMGDSPSQEYEILLDYDDTTTVGQGFIELALNLVVPAGKKIGTTVTYFPAANSYHDGDTIDYETTYEVTNKINTFVVYNFKDNDMTGDKGFYNNELVATIDVRYDYSTGWPGRYIPGTAWTTGYYNFDMFFKLTTLNYAGIENKVDEQNLMVYPNVVPAGSNFNISLSKNVQLKIEEVSVYNLTGSLLIRYENSLNENVIALTTNSLQAGIYQIQVKLNSSEYLTEKLIVY